ncbi:MAG: cobalamin biosynthesis protein P47K [Planctomycetaceae bacterium]|jgi:Ni2+-binding GTPase involved in maturation of urease and hydrogenase|nr:cobalamin biosynthesis protein P47K [Planctomycetaceae bacterium]MBP60840.1 cobalamin biosynthesis protein P47K [Planctomycetaceae bacterium]
MSQIQFFMLGGFLGAGKTTALARMARQLMSQGKKVALVTNDQAHDLVDTQSLRTQGFRVGEVPGACFCCKFSDLVDVIEKLDQTAAPDVILAEPVGSCTDLESTVIAPLQKFHGLRVSVGPLAILLKPGHGSKILSSSDGGFSKKAAYIFLKQIEEAQLVAINKIDALSSIELEELRSLLEERFPGKRILPISAKTGEGFGEFMTALHSMPYTPTQFMDVDYDVYAEGEAELAWLNGTLRLESKDSSFDLDHCVLELVSGLRQQLLRQQAEPAHLKISGETSQQLAVANLVDSESPAELSVSSGAAVPDAQITVNARVVADPLLLEELVLQVARELASRNGLILEVDSMERFRPSRPVPTHRFR